ncbi:MAG: hypothetical protein HYZ12_02670 [Thaumarchaeota archaeon]|nr:hypothetical protein [Nitrososphaerota archaeon]
MALGFIWMLDVVLAGVSALVLMIALAIYVKNWYQTRGRLLGLIIVAVSLFTIANISAVFYYLDLAESYGPPVAIPIMVIQTLYFAGSLLLLAVTSR